MASSSLPTEIFVNQIKVPAQRMRAARHDPSGLAESISEIGLINPITVTEEMVLVSGLHRLEAVKLLGWEQIPAIIRDFDEVEAELAEIDENLKRSDLTVWEQGKHIARREELLEARGLRARRGRPEKLPTVGSLTNSELASEAGLSSSSYRYRKQIGKKISEEAGAVIDEMIESGVQSELPDSTRQLTYLAGVGDPDDQLEIVTKVANGEARDVWEASKSLKQEKPVRPEPHKARYVTLSQWKEGERIDPEPAKTSMNRVNENIEWAAWSWNPITGCLHNCPYCYARDIAERFYEQKFEPSFVPERLSQPGNTKAISPRWPGDTGHRNIFTCSMADLFGKWVPTEWIEAVLKTVADNPQWTFLFLTKFPIRMSEFEYPANVWLGTTVDRQYAVERAEKAFRKVKASGFEGVCWLSCEPMLERLTFSSLEMFDWVVMGGASKSSQTSEYLPPFDDIVHLYNQARAAGCMVYQKTNLIPGMRDEQRLREYPK